VNTIPDQHLFTVRGRPVMFRKDEVFGALHAVERGYYPITHSGYLALGQPACDEGECHDFFDLLSENFLESLAVEKEIMTNEVLHKINQCARQDATGQNAVIHHLERASCAFSHGLFATDAQRWQLWQSAHETYSKLFDSDSIRFVAKEDRNVVRFFEYGLHVFDALRQCMRGEFTCEKAKAHPFVIHLLGYFELPPRPEGEPVIAAQARTLEFDFGD